MVTRPTESRRLRSCFLCWQEAKYLAADAERKYEEVARKMNMMENDLGRAANRADHSEDKIVELEVELKVVGDNMKAMEVRI